MTGIYVSVKPDQSSLRMLARIAQFSALPMVKPDELHCTVVTSFEGDSNQYLEVANPLLRFHSVVSGITVFKAPSLGGKVLVLEMQSEDLTKRNAHWKALGVEDSFPSYKPHVTLTPNIDQFPDNMISAAKSSLESVLVGRELVFRDETMTENKYAKP